MHNGNLVVDGTQMLMACLAVNDEDYTNEMEYLGGFTGFLKQLSGMINMLSPRSVYVAFDTSKSKYRSELHPTYKHGRHAKVSEELAERFKFRYLHTSYLRMILPMLGCSVMTCDDVEADDIIANFVQQSGRHNTIISTDKDFIQLVNHKTRLYRAVRNPVLVTESNLTEILGFDKSLYLKTRILEGDKSDNIPGVDGVGAKTALKIFEQAGSSDPEVIKEWAKTVKYKYAPKLIEFIESGNWELNDKLMNLTRGPVIDIKSILEKPERDYDGAFGFMTELKVDDFMDDEDIHRILYAFEELKE